jgi:hypothetical protein
VKPKKDIMKKGQEMTTEWIEQSRAPLSQLLVPLRDAESLEHHRTRKRDWWGKTRSLDAHGDIVLK